METRGAFPTPIAWHESDIKWWPIWSKKLLASTDAISLIHLSMRTISQCSILMKSTSSAVDYFCVYCSPGIALWRSSHFTIRSAKIVVFVQLKLPSNRSRAHCSSTLLAPGFFGSFKLNPRFHRSYCMKPPRALRFPSSLHGFWRDSCHGMQPCSVQSAGPCAHTRHVPLLPSSMTWNFDYWRFWSYVLGQPYVQS
jgi:hypothetical protein